MGASTASVAKTKSVAGQNNIVALAGNSAEDQKTRPGNIAENMSLKKVSRLLGLTAAAYSFPNNVDMQTNRLQFQPQRFLKSEVQDAKYVPRYGWKYAEDFSMEDGPEQLASRFLKSNVDSASKYLCDCMKTIPIHPSIPKNTRAAMGRQLNVGLCESMKGPDQLALLFSLYKPMDESKKTAFLNTSFALLSDYEQNTLRQNAKRELNVEVSEVSPELARDNRLWFFTSGLDQKEKAFSPLIKRLQQVLKQ